MTNVQAWLTVISLIVIAIVVLLRFVMGRP
jgi:hypothetical protein